MADQLVDPDVARPMYLRIADQLRDSYTPGGMLKSAPKVAAEWGVARETVRAALDVLRRDNLIVTVPGRGTYYRAPATDENPGPEAAPATEAVPADQLSEIIRRLDDIERRLRSVESRSSES